jgi:hypothetical protein
VSIRIASSLTALSLFTACASQQKQRIVVEPQKVEEVVNRPASSPSTIEPPKPPNPPADNRGLPPGCSPMHGGIPATPDAPPRWFLATTSDSALVAQRLGRVLVFVDSGTSAVSIRDASVVLNAERGWVSGMRLDATRSRFDAKAGRYRMLVRQMLYDRWSDSVTIREGYADTLRVGLGRPKICFT